MSNRNIAGDRVMENLVPDPKVPILNNLQFEGPAACGGFLSICSRRIFFICMISHMGLTCVEWIETRCPGGGRRGGPALDR